MACTSDCRGWDVGGPHVCDLSRFGGGDCSEPENRCDAGEDFQGFECRDMASCMLRTCRRSDQECVDLCQVRDAGGGWPTGWQALRTCMQDKCPSHPVLGSMDAETCMRVHCRPQVENANGCDFPLHAYRRVEGPLPPCVEMYECLLGCRNWDDARPCEEACEAVIGNEHWAAVELIDCVDADEDQAGCNQRDWDCIKRSDDCGDLLESCFAPPPPANGGGVGMGGDCRNDECRDDLVCVLLDPAHVCSKSCANGARCPEGWSCARLPDADGNRGDYCEPR